MIATRCYRLLLLVMLTAALGACGTATSIPATAVPPTATATAVAPTATSTAAPTWTPTAINTPTAPPTWTPTARPPTATPSPAASPTPFGPVPTIAPNVLNSCADDHKPALAAQALARLQPGLIRLAYGDKPFSIGRGQCVFVAPLVAAWLSPLTSLPALPQVIEEAHGRTLIAGGIVYFPKHHLKQYGDQPALEAFAPNGAAYIVAALIDNNSALSKTRFSFMNSDGQEEAFFAGRSLTLLSGTQPGCPCLGVSDSYPAWKVQFALLDRRYSGSLAPPVEVNATSQSYNKAMGRVQDSGELEQLEHVLSNAGLLPNGSLEAVVDGERPDGLGRQGKSAPRETNDYRALGAPARDDKSPIVKTQFGNLALIGSLLTPNPDGVVHVYALAFQVSEDNGNGIVDSADKGVRVVALTPGGKMVPFETIVRPSAAPVLTPVLGFQAGSCVVNIEWDGMNLSIPSLEPLCL
jgi:hypothetical protein